MRVELVAATAALALAATPTPTPDPDPDPDPHLDPTPTPHTSTQVLAKQAADDCADASAGVPPLRWEASFARADAAGSLSRWTAAEHAHESQAGSGTLLVPSLRCPGGCSFRIRPHAVQVRGGRLVLTPSAR